MCGKRGIINFDRKLVNQKVLNNMTDSLSHRGPNGRGVYKDSFIGLGHRRLSIIDLTERASQPMTTHDKNFIITYSGEVYNFNQIRKQLIKKNTTNNRTMGRNVSYKF